MKIEKTMVDFIDEALGNLDDGMSMLFIADSFTLDDLNTLFGFVALNFIRQGGGCVGVFTSLPFSLLFGEIKSRSSKGALTLIETVLREGRVYYLDIVSDVDLQEPLSFDGVVRVSNDLDRILYEIDRSRERIKKAFPDIPIMVLYSNLSSSIIDLGSAAVLKMFRRLTTRIKQRGDVVLSLVNRDLHDSRVINTLIHFADFVLEFSSEERGGVKQPYMQVLKSPISEAKRIQRKHTYIITANAFLKIPAKASVFDKFKRSISLLDGGKVSVRNVEYLITPLDTYILLFKELENHLGQNEYRELMSEFGRSVGLKIVSFFKSEYGLEGDELFKEALNYFLIRGWGRIIKMEGSPNSGWLKLYLFSALAKNYGKPDYPVCVVGEGIFSGMLEGTTGNRWTCREKNCMAMGYELCEFEAKVEK
ncbi:MAG: V4R domain-containing protein [Candidatus Freyarchaeota archaeon]